MWPKIVIFSCLATSSSALLGLRRYLQQEASPSSVILGAEDQMDQMVSYVFNTTAPPPPADNAAENNFNATNNNNKSDRSASGEDEDVDHMSIQTLLICVIGVILMCWCTVPRSPGPRPQSARLRRHRERQQRSDRLERMKDPKYREEVLRNSLYIQKVLKAEGGELTLGPPGLDSDKDDDDDDDDQSGSGRESIESFSEETNTCVICLEPYQVGDILAWSRRTPLCCAPTGTSPYSGTTPADVETGDNAGADATVTTPAEQEQESICNHVFHKDCIYSWLMNPKHDDCPACRATIAREPPQAEDGDLALKPSMSEDTEIFEQEGSFSNSVAFVVVHGLVSTVRRASYGLIGSSIHVEDLQVDECENNGVEMVPSPASGPVSLPAFPIRRVASYGDRPARPFLRRRSFGSMKESANETSTGFIKEVCLDPVPLRRTFSGGAIAKSTRTAGGGTVLVLKQDYPMKKIHPQRNFPPAAPRPVWSAEAERALGESLSARLSAAPKFVPTEIQGPAGLQKVFRRNPSDGFPPVPNASRPTKLGRKRSSYALLESSDHSESEHSAIRETDAAGVV